MKTLEELMQKAESFKTNRSTKAALVMQYMPLIDKLREKGASWREIESFFANEAQLDIKFNTMFVAYQRQKKAQLRKGY